MGCCSGKTAVKGPGFVRSHARVDISEDGLTATKAGGGKDRVAAMNTEMTEGKHFVEFNIEAVVVRGGLPTLLLPPPQASCCR